MSDGESQTLLPRGSAGYEAIMEAVRRRAAERRRMFDLDARAAEIAAENARVGEAVRWRNGSGATGGAGGLKTNPAGTGSSKWLGYLQHVQRYNTRNDLGQRVVNAANLLNADGTAHAAYEAAPGTRLGDLMMRQQRGEELTDAERRERFAYWRTNPTRGLAPVSALGTRRGGIGRRGAGAAGKVGNARGSN